MRPYRGIPIDGKDFVYGWYCETEGKSYIICTQKDQSIKAAAYGPFYLIYIEVIPETVGQASGRKDDNDKEIYEGDCFKTSDKHGYSSNCIAEVLFDEESCGFVVQIHRHDELEVWAELLPDYKRNFPDSFEIIGTVHTHPELLSKGK